MAKCTPRQITSVTNEQKRASTIWRKKKILFSVTIRKQDRPARSLVAILAMLPPTSYNGLSFAGNRE